MTFIQCYFCEGSLLLCFDLDGISLNVHWDFKLKVLIIFLGKANWDILYLKEAIICDWSLIIIKYIELLFSTIIIIIQLN